MIETTDRATPSSSARTSSTSSQGSCQTSRPCSRAHSRLRYGRRTLRDRRPPAAGADALARPRRDTDARAAHRLLAQPGLDLAGEVVAGRRGSASGARSTAISIPATSVACLSSASSPHGAHARSTSSYTTAEVRQLARSIAAAVSRAFGRPCCGSAAARGRTADEAGGRCGSMELRPSSTIDHGMLRCTVARRGPEVVRRGVGDQRRPHSLAGRRGACARPPGRARWSGPRGRGR